MKSVDPYTAQRVQQTRKKGVFVDGSHRSKAERRLAVEASHLKEDVL